MSNLKTTIFSLVLLFISGYSWSQTWQQYNDSAGYFVKQKKVDSIIFYYQLAKDALSKDSLHTDAYAKACTNLGTYQRKKREYFSEAEKNFIEARDTRVQLYGKLSPRCLDSYFALARFYSYTRVNNKKAQTEWLNAKAINDLQDKNESYAHFYHSLGVFYTIMEEFKKADSSLLVASGLIVSLLGKTDSNYASVCYSRGELYAKQDLTDTAKALFQEARQIFYKLGKYDRDYANCLLKLGVIERRAGNNDEAETLLKTAMRIYSIYGTETPDYAEACNSLANVYRNKCDFAKAEYQYKEYARIIKIKLGENNNSYANALNNLGNFYKEIGQYNKAESHLAAAGHIYEKTGERKMAYAANCINLASLYQRMDKTAPVQVLYDTAKLIIERIAGKRHTDYAIACAGLAAFYLSTGENEKAADFYSEAKDILGNGSSNQNTDMAGTYNGLGIICEKRGSYSNAEQYYKFAKDSWEKVLGRQHPYYRAACVNLANLYWKQDKTSKADVEFTEAFSSGTENLEAVFQFTNEKEKTDFVKNIFGGDDKAYSFYYLNKLRSALPYELSLFHRNIILSSLQNMKAQLSSVSDSVVLKNYVEWANLRNDLSDLYTQPASERSNDVAAIEARVDTLEKQLVQWAGFKKNNISWKDIRDSLKQNEASIEFAYFHFNPGTNDGIKNIDSVIYVAIILKKDDDAPLMVPLCSAKELNKLFTDTAHKKTEDLTKELYTFSINPKAGANKSLYDLIWKPMENELKEIKTIYFAPAGTMHKIAFAAIPVDDDHVLQDKYNLVQLSSTELVAKDAVAYLNTGDALVTYGGIEYDADSLMLEQAYKYGIGKKRNTRSLPDDLDEFVEKWSYLQETATEINSINQLNTISKYNIKTISGASATEESLKALDGKSSPVVLHIASHGFFFPKHRSAVPATASTTIPQENIFVVTDDPLLRSGLIFAGANNKWTGKPLFGVEDGILTAYEISNLYLPNTKLAVLSACETALGDIVGNEGVYGLQRAFRIAGVQNLVMSLWRVPSAETTEFMGEFYKRLFNGASITDAFNGAQGIMRSKYKDDPYYWAAWVLIR